MLPIFFQHPLYRTALVFSLISATIAFFAILLAPLLVPIIISFALYALLEPVAGFFERYGLPANASSLSVLFLLVAIAALGISLLLPHLSSQLSLLQVQLPGIWETITSASYNLNQYIIKSSGIDMKPGDLMPHFIAQANEWGKTALLEGSNIVVNFTVVLILIPVFTFFLIRDFRTFRNRLLDRLPNAYFESGWLIYYRVAHQLQAYIRGIMIQSGIMSIITTIGFYAIGLESAFLAGLFAGVFNLIPYIGPLLAMILPVLIALGHAPMDLWLPGAAITVILIAQIIDNVFVIPSIIADSVNLHPLAVITGIIISGNLFGFTGMVVAIPVISSANIIFCGLYQGIKTRDKRKKKS
ncbi:MAG TPA: AI-2E family transporter [Gammaproteobacteria bacterium]|nr:AI-2E family transporter [Gammaproteobacteria bacterium]